MPGDLNNLILFNGVIMSTEDFIFNCSWPVILYYFASRGFRQYRAIEATNVVKSAYLVVVHTWFIDSKGWYEFRLYDHTLEQAEVFALKMEAKLRNKFCHVSSKVFPIF